MRVSPTWNRWAVVDFMTNALKCADITPVFVVTVLALLALGMQPGIQRQNNLFGRFLHRPSLGGAIVIRDKTGDGRLAGDMADSAAADAVGHGDSHAFGA